MRQRETERDRQRQRETDREKGRERERERVKKRTEKVVVITHTLMIKGASGIRIIFEYIPSFISYL